MRTAVPGGANLISESGLATQDGQICGPSLGKKSKHAGHSRARARSACSGSTKSSSWLTRTLQKAFHTVRSEEDLISQTNAQNTENKQRKSSSFKLPSRGRSGQKSHKKAALTGQMAKATSAKGKISENSGGKIPIPQVEVTFTPTSDSNSDLGVSTSNETKVVKNGTVVNSSDTSQQSKKSIFCLGKKR